MKHEDPSLLLPWSTNLRERESWHGSMLLVREVLLLIEMLVSEVLLVLVRLVEMLVREVLLVLVVV